MRDAAGLHRHAPEIITGLAADGECGRLLLQLRGHVAEPRAGRRDAARGQQGPGESPPLLRRAVSRSVRQRRQVLLKGAQRQRKQLATRPRFDALSNKNCLTCCASDTLFRAPGVPRKPYSGGQILLMPHAHPRADAMLG